METPKRNTPEKKWYVTKAAHSSLTYRDELKKSGLEFFLPTRFVIQNIGNKRMRVERPVVFNFIFIRGTVFEVKAFCRSQQGLYMVYRHRFIDEDMNTESQRLLTVGDKEMSMFALTVGEYTSDVPFIKPSEVDLSKGDHVRITEGPFAGVEGVLLSQQGKDGGRVLVSISNIISVPTLEIKPEYLQVISFAPAGKHMYKKFDSFTPKARRALRNYLTSGLETKDKAAMTIFLKRFSTMKTHTVNARVKLLVSMLICHTCMEDAEKKATVQNELTELLPTVKSEQFRALALVHLFAASGKEDYKDEVTQIIYAWGTPTEKEKTKNEIIEDLQFFADSFLKKDKGPKKKA